MKKHLRSELRDASKSPYAYIECEECGCDVRNNELCHCELKESCPDEVEEDEEEE